MLKNLFSHAKHLQDGRELKFQRIKYKYTRDQSVKILHAFFCTLITQVKP